MFSLIKIKSICDNLKYDKFKDKIIKDIENQLIDTNKTLKLREHIENSKNKTYDKIDENNTETLKIIKSKIFGDKYFLDEIVDLFTENKFNQIKNIQEKYNQEYFPVLTFHATTNASKVNSIIKFGYLIPGFANHPVNKWRVCTAHGKTYGEGIYTTNVFDILEWLTFYDKNENIQLIVNIVFLGKTKIVNKYQYENYTKKDINRMKKDNKKNLVNNTYLNNINNFTIPELKEHSLCYDDYGIKFNTLISENGLEIVCGNPEQVIPLFLVNMKMNTGSEYGKLYFINNKSSIERGNFLQEHYYKLEEKKVDEGLEEIENKLINNIIKIVSYCFSENIISEFKNKCNFLEKDLFNKFKREINSTLKIINDPNKSQGCKNNLTNISINKKFISYFNKLDKNRKENLHNTKQIINYFKEVEMKKMIKISLGKDYYLIKHSNFNKYNEMEEKEIKLNSYIVYSGELFQSNINFPYFEQIHNFSKTLKSNFNGFYYGKSKIEQSNSIDKKLINKVMSKQLFNYYENITNALQNIFDNIILRKNENNIIYMFIGTYKDSEQNKKLTEKFIREYLVNYGLIIRIIFLGEISQNILKIKHNYENTKYYEANYYLDYDLNNPNSYFMDTLTEQEVELNNNLLNKMNWRYNNENYTKEVKTLYPYGTIGEGFIENIELQPVWDIKTISDYSLYKGINDKFKCNCEIKVCEMRKLQEDDLELVFDELIYVISKFRNYLIINPDTHRKRNILLEELIKVCLDIDKNIVIKKNMNIKFSRKIKYFISSLVSDIKNYSKIKFSNENLKKLMAMRHGKRIINRANIEAFDISELKNQVQIELSVNERSLKNINLIDALHLNKRDGYLIETAKGASSEIEPWNIVVKYVSDTKMPLSEYFIKNQCFEQIKDGYGKNVTDLLLFDKNESIHHNDYINKLYYGYMYTGIPECYIEGQEISLLMNSFSSLLEKILKKSMSKIYYKREDIDVNEIIKYINLAKKLENKIKEKYDYTHLANRLLFCNSEEEMEYLISTKNNIISLNKITLCFISKPELVLNKTLLKCLIKECICRNAKMFLANEKNRDICYYEILLKLFNINKNNYSKYGLQVNKTALKTNNFFIKNFTNCSLYTLISTINYFRKYEKSIEELSTLYYNNEINMLQTLKDIVDFKGLKFKNKTKNIQLALYIYGIKNCFQNIKESFVLENSDIYIEQVLNNIIEKYKSNINKTKKLNEKHYRKELKRLETAEQYIDNHKLLKIFNYEEIAILNEAREKDDQLELMDNGLLKHHCCYVDCPHYLKNFFNSIDIYNYSIGKTNSRLGLMNHFKYDVWSNTYIKCFHKTAKTFYRKPYEKFVECMKKYYENDKLYHLAFKNYKYINELLLSTWKSYNNIN